MRGHAVFSFAARERNPDAKRVRANRLDQSMRMIAFLRSGAKQLARSIISIPGGPQCEGYDVKKVIVRERRRQMATKKAPAPSDIEITSHLFVTSLRLLRILTLSGVIVAFATVKPFAPRAAVPAVLPIDAAKD